MSKKAAAPTGGSAPRPVSPDKVPPKDRPTKNRRLRTGLVIGGITAAITASVAWGGFGKEDAKPKPKEHLPYPTPYSSSEAPLEGPDEAQGSAEQLRYASFNLLPVAEIERLISEATVNNSPSRTLDKGTTDRTIHALTTETDGKPNTITVTYTCNTNPEVGQTAEEITRIGSSQGRPAITAPGAFILTSYETKDPAAIIPIGTGECVGVIAVQSVYFDRLDSLAGAAQNAANYGAQNWTPGPAA